MAAITTAARIGTPLGGSTLLTDTFPCHNCARHIVATGIMRVVYIAPYAKSRAYELHSDSIIVAPTGSEETNGKVVFEPFIGVSPQRFDQWFADIKRKDDSGNILPFNPATAAPRIGSTSDQAAELEVVATAARENAALEVLIEQLPTRTPTLALVKL